jgi:6-phosphogluconolactonase
LTEVSGSPFDTGLTSTTVTSPISITVPPSGQFIYIANHATSNITVFSIDSTTGFPTAVTGSPFGTGSSPVLLVSDPNGKSIYVLSQSATFVSELSINSTSGAVSSTSESPSTTTVPVAIAVSK